MEIGLNVAIYDAARTTALFADALIDDILGGWVMLDSGELVYAG